MLSIASRKHAEKYGSNLKYNREIQITRMISLVMEIGQWNLKKIIS